MYARKLCYGGLRTLRGSPRKALGCYVLIVFFFVAGVDYCRYALEVLLMHWYIYACSAQTHITQSREQIIRRTIQQTVSMRGLRVQLTCFERICPTIRTDDIYRVI